MSKELNKAPVEQAGGDERAAQWHECTCPKIGEKWNPAKHGNDCPVHQARAALAQPSPAQAEGAPVVGCLCGMPMTEGHHSPDGCCNLEEFAPNPAQAQAVQAEGFTHFPELMESVQQMDAMLKANSAQAERPEVVARVVHSNPVVLDHCAPLNANDELMTVSQHAASVARWAEMFNRVEQERDAALARVAELTATRNRYGVDAHYFNKNLQRILRDFESFTPDELARSLIILAKVADEKVVAQAQHSVPEGWMLVECGIWTQEQVDEMQKTVARFRNSEFVDDRALAMAVADAGQCKAPEISLAELLAAAPGKDGV
ncbi:TPA: hypothetical protein ACRNK7_000573 [Pseudomonas aeruginosa]